jgi:hypothetical protein
MSALEIQDASAGYRNLGNPNGPQIHVSLKFANLHPTCLLGKTLQNPWISCGFSHVGAVVHPLLAANHRHLCEPLKLLKVLAAIRHQSFLSDSEFRNLQEGRIIGWLMAL